jgi:hypothetical protein
MIIQEIIKNNETVSSNYIFNLETIIEIELNRYSVNYMVFFSREGKIYLFYNLNTLPDCYSYFVRDNALVLQLFDKISFHSDSVKRIDEYTDNQPYYSVIDNKLKFIANKKYGGKSWSLKLPTGSLSITNIGNKLPYMSFTYNKISPSEKPQKYKQYISKDYISLTTRFNSNKRINDMYDKLNYTINYNKSYVFEKKGFILRKTDKIQPNILVKDNNEKPNEETRKKNIEEYFKNINNGKLIKNTEESTTNNENKSVKQCTSCNNQKKIKIKIKKNKDKDKDKNKDKNK